MFHQEQEYHKHIPFFEPSLHVYAFMVSFVDTHCLFLLVPGLPHCYAHALSMQFKASAAYRTQRQRVMSFVCVSVSV